jgi:hypothetical protein
MAPMFLLGYRGVRQERQNLQLDDPCLQSPRPEARVEPSCCVSLSLGARNLLHGDTVEFRDDADPLAAPVRAAFYAEARWKLP